MDRDFWSDDAKRYLVQLIDAGHSYSTAGTALHRSRSAVAGMVKRLGLSRPDKSSRSRKANATAARAAIPYLALVPVEPVEPVALFAARRNQCRWPLWGDQPGPDPHVCGAETVEGTSWCPEHKKICTTKGTKSEQMATKHAG